MTHDRKIELDIEIDYRINFIQKTQKIKKQIRKQNNEQL